MRKQTTLLATFGLILTMSLTAAACGNPTSSEASKDNSSQSSSTGGNNWISSDWTEIPENTNKNLKYFGYFHSDGFGAKQSSYVNEIAALGNANMAMVNSAFTVEEVKKDLADVKNGGMKAILSIHGLFNGGATGKLDTAHLKSDYQTIWTAYQSEIQSFIDDGTIYAFYFDEPRWNGIGTEDFRTLTKYLRDTVPSVGTMACMTAMDIGIGNYGGVGECPDNYMEYCTDVMFDSYADWNDETRRDYLGKLKAKSNEEAWIWGCPKGFEAEPEVNDITKMVDHIKGQYTEAIQDERYAGIISFSYASGTEEGDWGYGLADFFNDQADYYSKELKDLYIEIGCAVTGKTPPEKVDMDFVVKEPSVTYALGDSVPLPEATATAGGTAYPVNAAVTAPDGSAVTVTDGAFKAEQAGCYEVTFTVTSGTQTFEKKTGVYVKSALEISTFESAAFEKDVTGSADDLWCWPRAVTVDFGRGDSRGSLKVTPHATDGTWPNVYFKYQGKEEIDMTGLGGVSMWLYNPDDEEITSFAVKINNGQSVHEATKTISLPSKVWTEFSITVAEMKALSPDLDLTKVRVAVTNSGSSYTNRTTFYIDDVYLTEIEPVIENAYELTFENSAYLAAVSQDNDSKWCWPTSLSDEHAHGGTLSLKVTPHATDGTWPVIVFKLGGGDTFDMTDYDEVSLWIYNPSDTVIESFGIEASDTAGKKAECVANIPAGEWTKLSIGKAALTAAGADITKLTLKFGNHASGYTNRTPFYVDDISLTASVPAPAAAPEIDFENAADTALLVQDDDSKWAWTCEISTEQAHGGSSSLKVNVRQDSGKWPVIVFKLGGGDTFDMTDYDEISLWVYNPSDTVIESFGITVIDEAGKKVDFTANLPAGEWTKLSIKKAELVAAGADITSLKLRFGNYASDYLNRTAFYVDDIKLS